MVVVFLGLAIVVLLRFKFSAPVGECYERIYKPVSEWVRWVSMALTIVNADIFKKEEFAVFAVLNH
jgi:hypothetical protein